MAFSCLPTFTQIFESFATTQPSYPAQQACDLKHIPYSSWTPPKCLQKCSGMCPHLPVSSDTRVNEQPAEKRLGKDEVEFMASAERARHAHIQSVVSRARAMGLDKLGEGNLHLDRVPQMLALRGCKRGFSAQGKDEGKPISTRIDAVSPDVRSTSASSAPGVVMADGGKIIPDLSSLCGNDEFDVEAAVDVGRASAANAGVKVNLPSAKSHGFAQPTTLTPLAEN